MKKRKTVFAGRSLWLLSGCAAVLALLVCLGVSFARYQKAKEQRLMLTNAAAAPSVYFLRTDGSFQPPEAWEKDENGAYVLRFLLSNAAADTVYADKTQEVSLCVASSVADLEKDTEVTLTVGTQKYTAVAEPSEETTVFGQRFGAGKLYRFFSQTGEELEWMLLGGRASTMEMTLTVTGGAPNTVYTLMAESAAVG